MSGAGRDGGVLDGFHVGQLPDGVGDEVSDFTSEWDDVRFASRVWERQVADGYRADLRVHILRGDRLTDLDALREFLAGYHERDPDGWALTDFGHPAGPGRHDESEAFWLVEPGIAGYVLVDPESLGVDALLSTALAVQRQP